VVIGFVLGAGLAVLASAEGVAELNLDRAELAVKGYDEPDRFAPQFGGYCDWAVSRGYTADIDPEAWRIIDGKLYLNYCKRVQMMWEQDMRSNIARAMSNRPGVLRK
jgi:hypothetical protein